MDTSDIGFIVAGATIPFIIERVTHPVDTAVKGTSAYGTFELSRRLLLKRLKAYEMRGVPVQKAMGKGAIKPGKLPGATNAFLFAIGYKGAHHMGLDDDAAVGVGLATAGLGNAVTTSTIPGLGLTQKEATAGVDLFYTGTRKGKFKWLPIPKTLSAFMTSWKIPAAELRLIKSLVQRGMSFEDAVMHVARDTKGRLTLLKQLREGTPGLGRHFAQQAAESADIIDEVLTKPKVTKPSIVGRSAEYLEQVKEALKETKIGKQVTNLADDILKMGFPLADSFGGAQLNPLLRQFPKKALGGASVVGGGEIMGAAAATWVGVPPGDAVDAFMHLTDEGNDIINRWTGDTPYVSAIAEGLGTYVGGSAAIGSVDALASASGEDIDEALDNFADEIAVANVLKKDNEGVVATATNWAVEQLNRITPSSWFGRSSFDLRDASGFVPMNVKRVDQAGNPEWNIRARSGNPLTQEEIDSIDFEADTSSRGWAWHRNPNFSGPSSVGLSDAGGSSAVDLQFDSNSGRYVVRSGNVAFSVDPFSGEKFGDWGDFAVKEGINVTLMSNTTQEEFDDEAQQSSDDLIVPGANP